MEQSGVCPRGWQHTTGYCLWIRVSDTNVIWRKDCADREESFFLKLILNFKSAMQKIEKKGTTEKERALQETELYKKESYTRKRAIHADAAGTEQKRVTYRQRYKTIRIREFHNYNATATPPRPSTGRGGSTAKTGSLPNSLVAAARAVL
ncbi:hypothetical protein EVAR_79493_1 [Eumeta japonica]|uniref:Uncharacterized protein n=1 Tax=Eumeta variegata TaxID=151549 RepID=A0A4C1UF85_EUMVA|nr:hypothetical protein EVAR_79493_1 [Eumeta japonica]